MTGSGMHRQDLKHNTFVAFSLDPTQQKCYAHNILPDGDSFCSCIERGLVAKILKDIGFDG